MRNDPHNHKRSNQEPQRNEGLQELTNIPGNVWETFMQTVKDSQEAISEAVNAAMRERSISLYELHEQTGLSFEFLDSVVEGTMDLSDSRPITKLEQALRVRLNHL